jgi:hypothetical protein
MGRSNCAVWLFVASAALAAVRADGEEVPNSLRLPDLTLRPTVRAPEGSLRKQLGAMHRQGPSNTAVKPVTFLDEELPPTAPPDVNEPDAILTVPSAVPWQGFETEPTVEECESRLGSYFNRVHSPHRDPNDPQRARGLGDPLTNTSWRNRPYYVDLFAGGLIGDELQEGLIRQGGGFFAGGRFGGDYDHYWGVETRLAFSDLNINYTGGGYGQSRDSFFDVSLLHYPWGDSRWRPYFSLGLGVAGYRFNNQIGTRINGSAMEMPFGGGVKYLAMPNLALRFDLIDNLSFAGGGNIDSMHNISFTGGIELRFGGRGTSYGSW